MYLHLNRECEATRRLIIITARPDDPVSILGIQMMERTNSRVSSDLQTPAPNE